MSLPAPYSEVYLAGDGVTTEFAFGTNFKPISAGLVKCIVYLEDGYAVVPTYTVNMAVGSITISALTKPDSTILTAPPLGSTVRIFRDEPEAQPVSASQIQSYTSKQLEILFDAIVAMIQEVSYTVDHKTVRLTEPQRDISLQKLTDLVDGHLIYWDAIKRELVVTNYPQQDVVQCVSGLFFKIETDPNTHNPYLEWSTDNSDWHAINVDAAQALAQDAYTLADDAYNLASTTRGELNAHKADHANPHETSMTNLIDTDFNNLVSGQFLQFDGIKWKNVNYTAVYAWGGIGGNIDDQADLKAALDGKVSTDGSSIMTGPLKMRATSSFQCAIAPFWDGVGFFKLNDNDSVTLMASIEYNSGFEPATTNTYNIGASARKWKNLYLAGKAYVATINNGADLSVPNKSGTLATMDDVELAARSGTQLTDQGVWYAKMYAATVAPAAENGTNYADFSQVDGQGNPIIVTYNRVNGAWVQDQTITPPAEYDGYVLVTSKIWDIAEQTGQQGGRVLWNHTSKEFTPYPQIISFEDINVTGNSTVDMPQNPDANQIVNKDYVDEAIAAIPTPTVDVAQSIDAEIVGTLTITDNSIVSGFSENNYLGMVANFNFHESDSFEVCGSFTTSSDMSKNQYIFKPKTSLYGITIYVGKTSQCVDVILSNSDNSPLSNQMFLNGITVLSASTKYWFKVVYDGTNYKLYLSSDGQTYNQEDSRAATLLPESCIYSIGQVPAPPQNYIAPTSIDMADWYVKYNNEFLWVGMDAPGLRQRVVKGHEVIDFQAPTAGNNYTWYRKYADGWVEQGGKNSGTGLQTTSLPITMADANYTILITPVYSVAGADLRQRYVQSQTTTSFQSNSISSGDFYWEAKGMAA